MCGLVVFGGIHGKWLFFFLWCSCFLRVCAVLLLLCPLYNPVGVVLLSFCVWARCIPSRRSLDFVLCRYSLLPKVTPQSPMRMCSDIQQQSRPGVNVYPKAVNAEFLPFIRNAMTRVWPGCEVKECISI